MLMMINENDGGFTKWRLSIVVIIWFRISLSLKVYAFLGNDARGVSMFFIFNIRYGISDIS